MASTLAVSEAELQKNNHVSHQPHMELEAMDYGSDSSSESVESEEEVLDQKNDQAKEFLGVPKEARAAQRLASLAEAKFLSFCSNSCPTGRVADSFEHAFDNFIVRAGTLPEIYKGPLTRQLRSLRVTARLHVRLCHVENKLSVHGKHHRKHKRARKSAPAVEHVEPSPARVDTV